MSKANTSDFGSRPVSLVKVRPRRSMQDLRNNNNNNNTDDDKGCSDDAITTTKAKKVSSAFIEDLPKELPSVKNLASMFNVSKKSPEPLPRRSLIKVRLNLD